MKIHQAGFLLIRCTVLFELVTILLIILGFIFWVLGLWAEVEKENSQEYKKAEG